MRNFGAHLSESLCLSIYIFELVLNCGNHGLDRGLNNNFGAHLSEVLRSSIYIFKLVLNYDNHGLDQGLNKKLRC